MTYPKKLIEVALPLEAINKESAREKSIRHGHPSTMHLWWARRPLAACRAVLFSSLIDDPSEYIDDEEKQQEERERLFQMIEELVKWETVKNNKILNKAKLEIARSVARNLNEPIPTGEKAIEEFLLSNAPAVLDPFAGGGSIPLEAQRLGLKTFASDLNPVAVLINKALIEIPPKFANKPPIHPFTSGEEQIKMFEKEWKGTAGLAEDVKYYGKWLQNAAIKQIGEYYPNIKITQEMIDKRNDLKEVGLKPGDELTVIAWLWARTVKCPNPACGAVMPLARTFELSRKRGQKIWLDVISPTSDPLGKKVKFVVNSGKGNVPKGSVKRSGAECLTCNTSVPFDYIREEGQADRIEFQLMSIVAENKNGKGRLYFEPDEEHIQISEKASPNWKPDTSLPNKALGFRVQLYGMTQHSDLFSDRQILALSTFSNLIGDLENQIQQDIKENQTIYKFFSRKSITEYVNALITFLAFSLSRSSSMWSSLCWWQPSGEFISQVFARQALAMVWDFAETNPFSNSRRRAKITSHFETAELIGVWFDSVVPGRQEIVWMKI